MPKPAPGKASAQAGEKPNAKTRNLVGVGAEKVTNFVSQDIPGHFYNEEVNWSVDAFRNHIRVEFHRNEPLNLVFSLVGVDASLANALRRILLSEIPTLAIDTVFIQQNTSVIQDEVLAHRLGLVPLKGDKKGLRWLQWRLEADEESNQAADPDVDFNTIQLHLSIECSWQEKGRQKADKGETNPEALYNNANVFASDIKFEPQGQQGQEYFTESSGPIKSTNPEILIAKLRPPQEIDLICHARKGLGRQHAKFSPVATASYRLLPVIDIRAPIMGDDAKKFQSCFPEGVIGLEKINSADAARDKRFAGHEGEPQAVVHDAIRDTVSRECLRHDEFKDKVKLGRQRDHFVFSVESVGQFDSDELLLDAIKVLKGKCVDLQKCLVELRARG